jgi:hypothetical protein
VHHDNVVAQAGDRLFDRLDLALQVIDLVTLIVAPSSPGPSHDSCLGLGTSSRHYTARIIRH